MVKVVYADWLEWLMAAYPSENLEDRKVVLLFGKVDKRDARNCQVSLQKKFTKTYTDLMPNHTIKMEQTEQGCSYWITEIPKSRLQLTFETTNQNDEALI